MASGAQADIWAGLYIHLHMQQLNLSAFGRRSAPWERPWVMRGQIVKGSQVNIKLSELAETAAHKPQIIGGFDSVLLHQNPLEASWMFVFQDLRTLKPLNHLTVIQFSR